VLPRAVLFIGIALIAVHVFRSRPSSVEVVYEYGGAERGLVTARMTYWQGAEVAHRLQLDYRHTPPGPTHKHSVKLQDGDYEVELLLTYVGDPPPGLGGESSRAGKETKVTIRRPLPVHGSASLHIYVKPTRD
jgi:hypothetical protein